MILTKLHIPRQILLSLVLAVIFLPARAQDGPKVDTTIKALLDQDNAQDTTTYVTTEDSSKVSDEEQSTTSDKYVLRQLPDSMVRRLKRDPDFAYANDPGFWVKKKPVDADPRFWLWLIRILSSKAFYYTLYSLLGLLLLYVIIRIILDNNVRLFYRSPTKKKKDGPEESDDLAEEDIEQRLKESLLAKDWRQATRYLYLISLSKLDEKQLIRRKADTTNQEYVSQLRGSAWESPFRYLTGLYEKVWYGDFPLQESQFDRLRSYFEDFYKTIGKLSILLLLLTGTLVSCNRRGGDKKRELNRRITMRRTDKNPYGTKVAYDGLSQLFPDAEISVVSKAPTDYFANSTKSALIVIAPTVEASPAEVTAVLNYVGNGNHVFISARHIADTLLHALGLKEGWGNGQQTEMDSLRVKLYDRGLMSYHSFVYPGDGYDNWFTSLDTQYANVMGKDSRNRPNFVRYTYKGGGSLSIQLAPLAFSNFFLLHKDNLAYYEKALSNLPSNLTTVYWDDYFRYYDRNHGDFSALGYIMNNKSLRLGFWLLLILFALIYLFDSKRRQRMIPLISPLRNTSVDFVRTIGRLYYQRRDNHNLAMKMVAHFQDQVRTRYHMASPTLDEDFIDRLSYRTGYPKESLTRLVTYMQTLPAKAYVPDEELLDFHQQLDAFYKTA